jgi:hypothetical protein
LGIISGFCAGEIHDLDDNKEEGMEKNYVITTKLLKSRGVCSYQVRKFRELFGESAAVTVAGCRKVAGEFDWGWAARNLLPDPADKAWREATASADKAWQEARATVYKAWRESTTTVYKAWREIAAPADKAWQEARATAFARCARKYGVLLREE